MNILDDEPSNRGNHRVLLKWWLPLILTLGGLFLLNYGLHSWFAPPSPVIPPTADTTSQESAGLLFSDNFEVEDNQTLWQPLSGVWTFEPGVLVQTAVQGADQAIVLQNDTFTTFELHVALIQREGSGGGVLFNIPDAGSRNGAHMVRYTEDERFLTWGYFDASGTYVGQGSADVPPAGAEPHQFKIQSDGNSYSIWLDDISIARRVPLVSRQGYIGLTATDSVVAFESVEVLALNASLYLKE